MTRAVVLALALCGLALPVLAEDANGGSFNRAAPATQAGTAATAGFALFEIEKRSGRSAEALAALEHLDAILPPKDAERADLATDYERIGQPAAALSQWERFAASGAHLGNDQIMRMAHLQESEGRKSEALQSWQAAWERHLPLSQRDIAEDRIVALADELGLSGELAAQLEARQFHGLADRGDSSLLLRIYVKAGHKAAAIEVVDEDSGRRSGDERQLLHERANVYQLLHDDQAFERSLKKLIEIDPAGRSDYLRSLVMHYADLGDGGRAHIGEVRHLLAQLRGGADSAGNEQFEAGILGLAGFPDEAIAAYRRAIVLAPQLSDNYLLLGDTLKRASRGPEVLTLFQYLAVRADSDPLHVAAIDGMLNTFEPAEAGMPDSRLRAFSDWTQRVILERVVGRDDALLLHAVLDDVADSSGDVQRAFATVESSLPMADELRSTLLRELITLAAGDDGDHLRVTLKDGPAARFAYGRRLLALGEVLPPDVYVSMGKDDLRSRDPDGAAHVFDLALENSGNAKVLSETAQLYDEAGYDDLALRQYRRALGSDRTDVGAMISLARVLERKDRREDAQKVYGSALRTILTRQPDAAPDAGGTREYKKYHETIISGLLSTWPHDPAQGAVRLDELEHLVTQQLAALSNDDAVPFLNHVRLDSSARALRRLAVATRNADRADRVDDLLLKRFAGDETLSTLLAQEHGTSRLSGGSTGDLNYARNLSLIDRNPDQMLTAARAWVEEGGISEAVEWASHGRLDEARLRDLDRFSARILRQGGEERISGLLARDPEFIERLNAHLGQPFLSQAQLLQIADPAGKAFDRLSVETMQYIWSRLPAASRIELVEKLGARRNGQPRYLINMLNLWTAAVQVPLDREVAETLARTVLSTILNSGSAIKEPYNIMGTLLQRQFDPANSEVVSRVAATWRARSGIEPDFLSPLLLLQAGRPEPAIDALFVLARQVAKLRDDGADNPLDPLSGSLDTVQQAFFPAQARAIEERLDELEATDAIDSALLQLRYSALLNTEGPDSPRLPLFLAQAATLAPSNPSWLILLQNLDQERRALPAAARALEELLRLNPADDLYRYSLFATYAASDRPVDALQLNEAGPVDMRSAQFAQRMQSMSSYIRNLSPQAILVPQSAVTLPWEQDTATSDPGRLRNLVEALRTDNDAMIKGELRRLWNASGDVYLNAIAAGQSPSSAAARDILQTSFPARDSVLDSDHIPLEVLLQGERPVAKTLLDAVVPHAVSISELEDYLRSVAPTDESAVYGLAGYLAKAYAAQGRAEEKLAELTSVVADDRASKQDFALWLELLKKAPNVDPKTLDLLDRRPSHPRALPLQQLLSMARVYSAAGQSHRVADIYEHIALRFLGITFSNESAPQLTVFQFLEDARRDLDAQSFAAVTRDAMRLFEPPGDAPERIRSAYRTFVARVAEPESGIGTWKEALAALEPAVRKEDPSGAATAPEAEVPRQGNAEVGFWNAYEIALSISPEEVAATWSHTLASFGRNDSPGWLHGAADTLKGWLQDDAFDGDRALSLLVTVAYRLHTLGDVGASTVMQDVSAALRFPARYKRSTLLLALGVADAIGVPLDLATEQALVADERIEFTRIAGVVRRTAQSESRGKALDIGRRAAKYTQDDGLLAALAELAEQGGDEGGARQWQAMRRAAESARQQLEMR